MNAEEKVVVVGVERVGWVDWGGGGVGGFGGGEDGWSLMNEWRNG